MAKKYDITRQDADKYALQSQQRWKQANDQGHFQDEIEPFDIDDEAISCEETINERKVTEMKKVMVII